METFLLTIQQTASLLAIIFIGYFFKKKKIINADGQKMLAGLLVNLFSPAYAISNLSSTLSTDKLVEYLVYLLVCAVLTVFLIFIGMPMANTFGRTKLQKNILKYAFTFGNIGYFGYPLLQAVYPELLPAYIIFCIPMNIAIATYGYAVLTEKVSNEPLEGIKDIKKSNVFKRAFLSLPFIGTVIGIIIGLLPITLPKVISGTLSTLGSCQGATAMLLTGAVLANVPFKQLFSAWKPYFFGFIRLVIIPLIVIAILVIINLCGVHGDLFKGVAVLSIIASAMPIGMNVVVYPESAGLDSTEGAKTCFISYVLAVAFMPLVFMLMETITNGFV
ncbi:MAG: hypothetical protein E7346_03035 [Clostridiales bacterium]|nr:hypothetical protein [Clostridiales bacterium]